MTTSHRTRAEHLPAPEPPSPRAGPGGDTPAAGRRAGPTVAELLAPALGELLDDVPVRFAFWDGSSAGRADAAHEVAVRGPDALRHLLWAPGELGLGRAYVAGQLDVDGDLVEALSLLRPAGLRLRSLSRGLPRLVAAARELGVAGSPPPVPPEEARSRGLRHSLRRDRRAVSHHYDVGNDFYRLVLGPSMTYSCARFDHPGATLEDAQWSKHELVCRKLGLDLRPGSRLLDIGCGWGSMALHAARHHAASVTGVTISAEQLAEGRRRVAEAGLEDRVDLRLADYRELAGERFDAVSSIGMFEHVGARRAAEYLGHVHRLLVPGGRFLNHAISTVGGSRLGRRSFMGRYVFPDAELVDVGDVVLAMEAAGFEVRDVESLREHYAATLRSWLGNLAASWDRAVGLVGERRARVWRLYMSGSVVGFDDGGLAVHQVLGVRPGDHGASGMPPTRDGWATPAPG